jgi:small subunit ribosomal protein S1
LTVEEPQTTDAVSAATSPEASAGPETSTTPSQAAAMEGAGVEEASSSDVREASAEGVEEVALVNDAQPAEGALPTEQSPEAEVAPVNDADPAEGAADAVGEASPTDEASPTEDAEDHASRADDAPAAGYAPDRPEPTTMEELLAQQSGDIPSLKHGDVVEGTIVRIDKDEMLVDVGAKSEGVVSNRELYGRNAETQPDLSVGDTVLVYVLQPESTDGHAVLSLRRAGLERKWRAMQEQYDAGEIIEAPVIDHNKGGLIVDCGIRGFVPISQIVDFPRRPQNDQPRDAAQEIAEKLQPYVGRKLRLKILEVNRKANRLILSEKVALYEERREKRDELFSSLQVGQQVTGTVRSIAPFGIFIDLGGIDGLVHKSELSWNKVNNPEGAYEVGDEVQAEVIDINHERGRISLSIRRMQPDPWQSTVGDLKVGDLVDGTVTKIVNFGAFVRVKDGLEGLIHISELSHQRVAHPGDVVHEGQTLKLKIISLDSERHRLGLSLKQAEETPVRPARERRPRPERAGYDRSQAIQEPEGGIDNTLAAAFAQVRQQIAEQDAAEAEAVEGAIAEEALTEVAEVEFEAEAIEEAIAEEALTEVAEVAIAAGVAEEAIAEEALSKVAEVELEAEAIEDAIISDAIDEAYEVDTAAQAGGQDAAEAEAVEEAILTDALSEASVVEERADAVEDAIVAEAVVDASEVQLEAEAVEEAIAEEALTEVAEVEAAAEAVEEVIADEADAEVDAVEAERSTNS